MSSQSAPFTTIGQSSVTNVVDLHGRPYQANTTFTQPASASLALTGNPPIVTVGFSVQPATVSGVRDTNTIEGSDAMATSDELTQARIALAEAKTDTKIAKFESKIDTLAGKIDALSTQVGEHKRDRNLIIGTIITTVIVAALSLGALFVGLATYGDAIFGRGMNVRDVIQATVKDTLEQQKK